MHHVTAMSSPRHSPATLSQMLKSAAQHSDGEKITIGDVITGLKTQALALLLILFSLPNILPSPPGTTAIFGAPLVLLTLQMAFGWGVWLPRIITNRTIPRGTFLALMEKAEPYFAKIERLLRPRLMVMSAPITQRLLGAGMAVLSVMIMLPIPLANTAPSLAIILIAIGLVERDGLFILAGIAGALAAAALVITVYWTVIALAIGQISLWMAG